MAVTLRGEQQLANMTFARAPRTQDAQRTPEAYQLHVPVRELLLQVIPLRCFRSTVNPFAFMPQHCQLQLLVCQKQSLLLLHELQVLPVLHGHPIRCYVGAGNAVAAKQCSHVRRKTMLEVDGLPSSNGHSAVLV